MYGYYGEAENRFRVLILPMYQILFASRPIAKDDTTMFAESH